MPDMQTPDTQTSDTHTPDAYSLRAGQGHVLNTLYHGPGHCPSTLFAGPAERVLMGLKAHANTVSHARLFALEETFPRTMQRLDRLRGAGSFNAISRDYIEQDEVKSLPVAHIGRDFSEFLAPCGLDAASVDLAQIEWAWLTSYHAADAAALALSDIAALHQDTLLALPLRLHPAARIVKLHAALAEELAELCAPATTAAILIVRPNADVRLQACDAVTVQLFAFFDGGQAESHFMGNFLEHAAELLNSGTAQDAVIACITAGIFRQLL